MPAPISNNNSSVYDSSAHVSQDSDCDPSNATCAASSSPESQPAAPPAVTIPEVHIDGDARKQELLRRFDARNAPSCSAEAKDAFLACGLAGATAVAGVAASTTSVGFAGAVAVTLYTSAYCGKDLRALHDCEQQ